MAEYIAYADKNHENFYKKRVAALPADMQDSYHKALFYTAGILSGTRTHFGDLYDAANDCIKPDALDHSWQTSGTSAVTRLALHLFTGGTPTAGNDISAESKYEVERYAPLSVFGSAPGLAPLFYQAICIRLNMRAWGVDE